MWLVYPLTPPDIRLARQGVLLLLAGSALWYLTLAGVMAKWSDDVLYKVDRKFADLPPEEYGKKKTAFLLLLAGWAAAGGVRQLGYLRLKNVAGAVGAQPVLDLARVGGAVWIATIGTLYFGFSGLIGIVAAVGTACELNLIRFAGQLFGMVVSQQAARRARLYIWVRAGWLGLVVIAGLMMLLGHVLIDLPRVPGGPTDQTVQRALTVLRLVFNVTAGLAVTLLVPLTAAYWTILIALARSAGRLIDPTAAPVTPPPAPENQLHQLKELLQNPYG